uniref:Synaptobrevin, longin-like domain protein n=1 Tax=Tanacetum cinerariifolium TaxID=118510 RepID=A0A699HP34_TANCI|nr:synaptobrevin, longin-like domain protein [Tanacetum cinerariifolium]
MWSASCNIQGQRNLHVSGERLPFKERSGPCNDLIQASSEELLTDGKSSSFEDLQDCKLSKTAREVPVLSYSEQRTHEFIHVYLASFWSTARIETTKEGTKILATIDGNLRTVSESSIRQNLKLNDEAGISSLPDTKLFENLTLMGYNISPNQKFTFQKGQFSHQWKYLTHTIMQCLSPKSTRFNEFSRNIATALVCLATNRVYNFSKMIFDGEGPDTPTEPHHTPSLEAQQTSPTTHSSPTLPPVTTAFIPTVTSSDTPHLRQYTRRARIAQSSALPPVADEPASPLRDVNQGEACPTVSSLDAKQNRANIAKTSTLPHESTSRSDMVSKFKAQELEITMLKARVKLLEDREGGVTERSGDDAPIKGRRLDEGEEAAEKRSNDTEEMINVLTSMDAATVLSSEVAEVPTGSGSIPTAGPSAAGVPTGSDVVPTAGPIFAIATVVTPYTRIKGKEKIIESETPKKKKIQEQMDIQMARQLEEEMERDAQRMNEQIARDAEIARIHAEEELQMMINSLAGAMKQKFNTVWKQIEDFIPMGSKEETERFKRKGLRLEQESAKQLKTSEEVLKEVKSSEEVPKEKVKEMMQLVPVEEIYVEAL